MGENEPGFARAGPGQSLADTAPREAASVLLLRRGPGGNGLPGDRPGPPDLEVYMIRRLETLKFLGGFYAFPGGQVDPEDYETARRMVGAGRGGDGDPEAEQGLAHRIAAVRELYEECGVLLARRVAGGSADLEPGAPLTALDGRARDRLLAGEVRFSRILGRAGLRPDLEALSFLDRWVTPEGLPIRFDTKFYTAWMPRDQEPDPFPGEVSWGGWVSPRAALEDADSSRMPMVLSTMACLSRLLDL